ncbi:hypothetical protein AAC387_Pa01g1179 [Persea americana]
MVKLEKTSKDSGFQTKKSDFKLTSGQAKLAGFPHPSLYAGQANLAGFPHPSPEEEDPPVYIVAAAVPSPRKKKIRRGEGSGLQCLAAL